MDGSPVSDVACVVGVDPSSKKIAMAVDWGEGRQTTTFTTKKKLSRYENNYHFYLCCTEYFSQLPRPFAVFIEQPLMGRGGVRSTIVQAQAASSCNLAAVRSGATGIYEVNVQSWKKAVVGRGNASKSDVHEWLRESHPEWFSLCDGDQDRVDAACINLYGVGLVARGARLLGSSPGER